MPCRAVKPTSAVGVGVPRDLIAMDPYPDCHSRGGGSAAYDEEPPDLRSVLKETAAVARETGRQLLNVQRAASQKGMSSGQLRALNDDFHRVINRFQNVAQRPATARAQQPLPASADEEAPDERRGLLEHERGVADREGFLDAQRSQERAALRHAQQRLVQARAGAEALAERERVIKNIESTVHDVNDIMGDLATLVASQTEQFEHISTAIEDTVAKTSHAHEHLRVAAQRKARLRTCTCCLVAAGGLLLLLTYWSLRS